MAAFVASEAIFSLTFVWIFGQDAENQMRELPAYIRVPLALVGFVAMGYAVFRGIRWIWNRRSDD